MRFAKKIHSDTRCPCTSDCSLITKRATVYANVVTNGLLVFFLNQWLILSSAVVTNRVLEKYLHYTCGRTHARTHTQTSSLQLVSLKFHEIFT